MADDEPEIEVLAWADGRTAPLIERLLGRMGLVRVLGVGGPRKAQVTDLAASLDAPVGDDLRKMLIDTPPQYLLLACASGVTAAELQQAQSAGTTVLAIEPVSFDTSDLAARAGSGAGQVLTAPWWRMSRSWLNAADPQEALGEVRSLQVTCLGPTEAGSLFARLYDALEMVVHLLEVPEAIDASLTGPTTPAPNDLRGLTGHLTAHLRFRDGASAVLQVSDRAPRWQRQLQVLGNEGMLQLTDSAYRLLNHDGDVLDESGDDAMALIDPADLVARQWQRLLDGSPATTAESSRAILACCQATALSCRTDGPEAPATLMRLIAD